MGRQIAFAMLVQAANPIPKGMVQRQKTRKVQRHVSHSPKQCGVTSRLFPTAVVGATMARIQEWQQPIQLMGYQPLVLWESAVAVNWDSQEVSHRWGLI